MHIIGYDPIKDALGVRLKAIGIGKIEPPLRDDGLDYVETFPGGSALLSEEVCEVAGVARISDEPDCWEELGSHSQGWAVENVRN